MDNNKRPQTKAPNAQQKQQQPASKPLHTQQPGKAAPAQQKKPGSSW